MKAVEIFQSIVDNVVQQAASGVWYLEPLWMLEPGVPVDDAECMAQVREMLELAVKKKNAEGDLVHPAMQWIMGDDAQYAFSEYESQIIDSMLKQQSTLPDYRKWNYSKKQ